jgi:glycosyltransferase involved in cell wall biosynthesis
MLPLVSIVIPTFNYGHFVGEAVESALNQTYSCVEVIVIDDGSTDDTRERLAPYIGRIHYHYQSNAGLSAARNTGIRLAQGEFVALLDSDDAFHPRKLETQVGMLLKRPEFGLLATEHFSEEPYTWQELPAQELSWDRISLEDMVIKSRFGPSSVVIRRECLERVGLFDSELKSVEDRDMWIRIAVHYPIAVLHFPLTWYRETPGSMSRNAQKMEYYERLVLERAFAIPQLAHRRFLRRRAQGLALLAAARRYQGSKLFGTATNRLLASLAAWPFPFAKSEHVCLLGRLRLLWAIGRECLIERQRVRRWRTSQAA